MNVWMVNQYAISPAFPGGTRHYNLARQLVENGHHVRIFASNRIHLTDKVVNTHGQVVYSEKLQEGLSFEWVQSRPYQGNNVSRLLNVTDFSAKVLRLAPKCGYDAPDVILGSSPTPFAALSAQRLARKYRVPFVLEIRDLWPQSLIELGSMSERHPFVVLLRVIEKFLYRKANKIVTLLPGSAEYIESIVKGGSSKVTWVSNGVTVDPPEGNVELPSDWPDDSVFKVIYTGTHGLANSLHTAIHSFKTLQDQGFGETIQLLMVGDGPCKQDLMQMVQENKLRNVKFYDFVPKNVVSGLIQAADAGLVIYEDSPLYQWGISANKIWDYMSLQTPVLLGVTTPYDPVALSGGGMSFAPADSDALSTAIKQLFEMSKEDRIKMGENAAKYVAEHHSFDKLGATLEKVLWAVVEK